MISCQGGSNIEGEGRDAPVVSFLEPLKVRALHSAWKIQVGGYEMERSERWWLSCQFSPAAWALDQNSNSISSW